MAEIDLYESARGARLARQELRAPGYTGKNRFMVHCDGRSATVFAGDVIGALYTAARHWGMDPRKSEIHQSCRVKRC